MKLPIFAYGSPILKQPSLNVDHNSPEVQQLIRDLWETMENANGCGLSACQAGKALKIFVADSKTTYDLLEAGDRKLFFEGPDQGIKEVFINAEITQYSEETWEDHEGCLSIPGLSQKVKRPWKITVAYLNGSFEKQVKTFAGITARIIQHEYDHTNGILYLDHLKPLTKKLMETRLKNILKGKIKPPYPMKFL